MAAAFKAHMAGAPLAPAEIAQGFPVPRGPRPAGGSKVGEAGVQAVTRNMSTSTMESETIAGPMAVGCIELDGGGPSERSEPHNNEEMMTEENEMMPSPQALSTAATLLSFVMYRDLHPTVVSLLSHLDRDPVRREAARYDFLKLDYAIARPLLIYKCEADLIRHHLAYRGSPATAPRLAVFPYPLRSWSNGANKQKIRDHPLVRHVTVHCFFVVMDVPSGRMVARLTSQAAVQRRSVKPNEAALKLLYIKAKVPTKKQFDDCRHGCGKMPIVPRDVHMSALHVRPFVPAARSRRDGQTDASDRFLRVMLDKEAGEPLGS